MTTNRPPLSSEDLSLLQEKLPDILTCSVKDIEPAARVTPEAPALAQALRTFTEGIPRSREWMQHALVSVPLHSWRITDGAHAVMDDSGKALKYASLKYASATDAMSEMLGEPQFLTRKRLSKALFENLSPRDAEHFGAMISWGPLLTADHEQHPFLEDVRLADSINVVEVMFHGNYARLEAAVRRELGTLDSEPTSPAFVMRIAEGAQREVDSTLRNMALKSVTGDDSLIVRILSSIAANRALLELSFFSTLATKACRANIALVTALNQHDIHEVPEVMSDGNVQDKLVDWFGKGGRLSKAPGFERPLQDADLAQLLVLTDRVQAEYIRTRGKFAGAQAQTAFGTPENKLLFALGLVACFYGSVDVGKELFADHNNERKAFPSRLTRSRPLGKHSIELFKSLFGSLAFGNKGWQLRPDGMAAYAQAMAFKRGKLQELIFETFKNLHPEQVLAVHKELMADVPTAGT